MFIGSKAKGDMRPRFQGERLHLVMHARGHCWCDIIVCIMHENFTARFLAFIIRVLNHLPPRGVKLMCAIFGRNLGQNVVIQGPWGNCEIYNVIIALYFSSEKNKNSLRLFQSTKFYYKYWTELGKHDSLSFITQGNNRPASCFGCCIGFCVNTRWEKFCEVGITV